ncbi:MAG: hypothetical protein AB7U37_07240 [Synergistaceae bacterium]
MKIDGRVITRDQYAMEALKLIMKGFERKHTPAEQKLLAKLTGSKNKRTRGPIPKAHKDGRWITQADYRTPAAYKALAERLWGKPINAEPQWKEGCPRGTIKKKEADDRRKSRAKQYLGRGELKPMQIVDRMADVILNERSDGRNDADAQHSARMQVFRDVAKAVPQVHHETAVLPQIAESLQQIFSRHTTKPTQK